MANRQQKRSPRTTTNIVVRNGTAAPQARASAPATGNRRRRNRARRQTQVNVRVLPSQNQNRRRFPRRQGIGSRIVFQKINSTLGTVGSNGSEQIECELTCLLNPATMKEATGSNSFTPLSIYASTYSLFKMTRCTLVLKPLIGDNAVSGTVVRASWNPTSTPTQASWSSLGARKHIDVTPGKTARFTLTSRDLVGPKGGWFKTNTKGDPMMAFAGTIEIHTLGKTMSTYRGEAFTGGLFLVEMETHWQFKDYAQQPGMLNLVKGDDDQNAQVKTSADGKLQLVLPATSRMARASRNASSEIIWLVTDTIIQTGSTFLGPFGWLLRGGWWLIKRAAGAPVRADEGTTFDIYASISDARSNTPCLTDQEVNVTVGKLHYQQITPGNAGIDSGIPGTRAIHGRITQRPHSGLCHQIHHVYTVHPERGPLRLCVVYQLWWSKSHQQRYWFGMRGESVLFYNPQGGSAHRRGPCRPGHVHTPGPIQALQSQSSLLGEGSCFHPCEGWGFSQPLGVPRARVCRERPSTDVQRKMGHYPSYLSNRGLYGQANNTKIAGAVIRNLRIDMRQGGWYIVVYAVYGQSVGDYKVGENIIATKATGEISADPHNYTVGTNHYGTGMFPAYMTGLTLTPFTTSDVTYEGTLRESRMAQDLDPSFGCDDVFEFPPFDDEDEFEDPEDLGEDDDEELELGPDDDYSDPPISRLVVVPEAQNLYEQLRANFSEREARLAVNQLNPSGEYAQFTAAYHNALVDGLSPRDARAFALGL
nr:ORF2 [Mamastrovirus 3]